MKCHFDVYYSAQFNLKKIHTSSAASRRTGSIFSKGIVLLGALAMACAFSVSARANCLSKEPLRGVNMAGAEFNSSKLPGAVFKDYTYPAAKDLNYFADLGANLIRLPVRWERVQPTLNGPLDAAQVKLINTVVTVAKQRNMCIVVDLHNYGKHKLGNVASAAVPASAFIDFWKRVTVALPDVDHVALGLMNEPDNVKPVAVWAQVTQQTVTALRNSGAKHLILAGGASWQGAHNWMTFNAALFANLNDPLDRTIIEMHQYFDSYYSGTKADCISPEKTAAIFKTVKTWAKANNKRLFLGEFGVADTPACLATLQAALDAVRDEPFAGWAYWAAGAWWNKNYIFNVHPLTGIEHGQLKLLKKEWE